MDQLRPKGSLQSLAMRGIDTTQAAMFSYLSPEQRVPKDHPLRQIRVLCDIALKALAGEFDEMYSDIGRPSIAPEKLLRALLLQILYTIRSERMLMEQLNYNLLFRWFVGLNMDEGVWDRTVYSKNRERMLKADMARLFFQAAVQEAREEGLLSDEHFSVDGTLIEAWRAKRASRRKTATETARLAIAVTASISMASSGGTKRTNRRRTRTPDSTKRGRAKKPSFVTRVMC